LPSTTIQASRRLSILSTEEVDSLYGLPHFNEGERQIHFDLSPKEQETIDAARTITAGVHLVLQLGYFKAKAQFFVFLVLTMSALTSRTYWRVISRAGLWPR
jgi:hypothetical protein